MEKMNLKQHPQPASGMPKAIKTISLASLMVTGACETESLLNGASCASQVVLGHWNVYECTNLIDATLLNKAWDSGGPQVQYPDFTYSLTSEKPIQTVFIGNFEFGTGAGGHKRINPSQITVGNNADPTVNSICADEITDGGWFQCDVPLTGQIVSIHRTSDVFDKYALWTLRAYAGINVAQWATVVQEPVDHYA